jgi:nucleoprotein TPR
VKQVIYWLTLLYQERERAAGSVVSAAQHAELLERINQLNLLRESNTTLRAECDAHRKQTESLERKLRQISSETEPIKEEVNTLRSELEMKGQQLARLERENQQWKDRNQQILSKVCNTEFSRCTLQ